MGDRLTRRFFKSVIRLFRIPIRFKRNVSIQSRPNLDEKDRTRLDKEIRIEVTYKATTSPGELIERNTTAVNSKTFNLRKPNAAFGRGTNESVDAVSRLYHRRQS